MNVLIYEQASDWVIKQRNGGLETPDRKSFDDWLRESPQHVCAYLEMSAIWEDVPSLGAGWNPSADELIARARADNNVVPLSSSSQVERALAEVTIPSPPSQKADEAPRVGKRKFLYAFAASIAIAIGSGWVYLQRGVYSTEIGEQRSLALADGSTVELNSQSRIKVQYTGDERRVELLQGQAMFHVAKNKSRPFIVRTGDTRVRAVGTAFDVYRASADTVVTVVEGRVAVHANQASQTATGVADSLATAARLEAGAGEILLVAGEQLVVTPTAVTAPKRANVGAATAWTRRSLVFDSSSLTEVAREFNRYNTRRLLIEDAELEDFHISGVFSSVEPTLLLRFLRTQPELAVEETDTEIRIKKK